MKILVTKSCGQQLLAHTLVVSLSQPFMMTGRWFTSYLGRLSILSTRPAVTFPATKLHHPMASTKIILLADRGT